MNRILGKLLLIGFVGWHLSAARLSAQGSTNAAPLSAAATAPRPAAPAAAVAPTSGHMIAVVDIGTIFKESPRLKEMSEKMKAEAIAAEGNLKKEFEGLKLMAEQLQKLPDQNSLEAKQLETEITKRKLDFDYRRGQIGKDFAERESKMFFQVYQEVDQIVSAIAQRNGVALVLRHNSTAVNPNDKNDVMRGINRSIIYCRADLDITALVLRSYK